MPVSAGTAAKKLLSASTPPAEAPRPTTGKPGFPEPGCPMSGDVSAMSGMLASDPGIAAAPRYGIAHFQDATSRCKARTGGGMDACHSSRQVSVAPLPPERVQPPVDATAPRPSWLASLRFGGGGGRGGR